MQLGKPYNTSYSSEAARHTCLTYLTCPWDSPYETSASTKQCKVQ